MLSETDKKLQFQVERLLNYALEKQLIFEEDTVVIRNYLLSHFKLSEPYSEKVPKEGLRLATEILDALVDLSYEKGLIKGNSITERDLESAKIMGIVTPRQSEVAGAFAVKYKEAPENATSYFYELSQSTDYIQVARTDKNIYWQSLDEFNLEITINLSKPEKDPNEIAAARNLPPSSYPKCLLCMENAGYEGRLTHPARQNHRLIPLELCKEKWYFQYSPYLYYNEHSIILNENHVPMKISRKTFERLLDFIEQFPHYFIGSNADLPIVGGSILSHDHFQGGRHKFPMESAKVTHRFEHLSFKNAKISILRWPLTAIRLESGDKEELINLAVHLTDSWKIYSDEDASIKAFTEENGESHPHNTVTPIARKNADGNYEIDIVLRNNVTTDEFPLGIFHPHQDVHHIKKENIGLIEVMGLAVLPARLKAECEEIAEILQGKTEYTKDEGSSLYKHHEWINYLIEKYGVKNDASRAVDALKLEIALKFSRVLEDAGVYKLSDFGRERLLIFMKKMGFRRV